jgi:hypothetical protein
MNDRIFEEREKAAEANYFRQHDADLIKKLRERADLDEIALALREKLQVDNPDLLQKVRDLGITPDNAPAFFLAPLLQVAWAEGQVDKAEHATVLKIARRRGIAQESPAYAQLEAWLKNRPSDAFFDVAVEVMKYGFAVLPPAEQEERTRTIVEACHEVAEASGGLGRLLGLGDGVSKIENATLDQINRALRTHK